MPKWRNWQTHQIQGLAPLGVSGFKSRLRHQTFFPLYISHFLQLLGSETNRSFDLVSSLEPRNCQSIKRFLLDLVEAHLQELERRGIRPKSKG